MSSILDSAPLSFRNDIFGIPSECQSGPRTNQRKVKYYVPFSLSCCSRRAVLSTLRGVLNRCDSVPKLLASTDTSGHHFPDLLTLCWQAREVYCPSHSIGIRSDSLKFLWMIEVWYRRGIFGSRDCHPLQPIKVSHHCESSID